MALPDASRRISPRLGTRVSPGLLLSVLIAVALLVPGVVTGPARAATASAAHALHVQLASMSPATLSTGQDLTVSATVTNSSSEALSSGKATLTLGSRALDSLEAQQGWDASGDALTSTMTASTTVPDLDPGDSATVSLTVPAANIDVAYSMTTLPVDLSVSGTVAGASMTGRLHTTTPWTSMSQTFTPMKTQIVVPITLPSDPALFSATGQERFQAWNRAIGPGSAIDDVLNSDPSVPVTWLIDPAVLDPPTAQDSTLPSTANLAATAAPSTSSPTSSSTSSSSATTNSSGSSTATSGSSSASSRTSSSSSPSNTATSSNSASSSASSSSSSSTDTDTHPTTVDALAQRLRDLLANRASTQQVWFTPYGDPDLSALTSVDRPENADVMLRRMLARTLPASLSSISSTVVAAPVAPLSEAALNRLTTAWHAARGGSPVVITPNATLEGSSSSVSSALRRTTSGTTLLAVDSALSETLATSTMSDAEAAAATRSRSLAIYQQQPSTQRSVLALAPRRTISSGRLQGVADALNSLGWTTPSAVSTSGAGTAALARLQTVAPDGTGVWPRPAEAALTSSDVATTSETLNRLTRFSGIVQSSSDIVPAWGRNLDQVAGTRWRGYAQTMHALTAHGRATVEEIPTHVGVLPSGTINFFTDTGRITVTIRNDLARAVRPVTMHLHPRSYIVRFTSQPAPVAVDAGSRTGLRIPTAALAAGSVDVLATLDAANGVPLGADAAKPVQFTINARPTGTWIYWVLGIVAMLVFCYGLVRNHKKGTHRRDELARDIKL